MQNLDGKPSWTANRARHIENFIQSSILAPHFATIFMRS
jgi:hypothetical protein